MGSRLPAGGPDGPGSRGDERLEGLISAGLAGQAEAPVDVAGLLDGARTGARRIRRRRRAAGATALAVAIIGVPVSLAGTGLFDAGPGGSQLAGPASSSFGGTTHLADAGPQASMPAESKVLGGNGAAAPGPTDPPAGVQVSGTIGAVLSRDAGGQYVVGEQALLQASDLAYVAPVTMAEEGPTAEGAGPTQTPLCRTLPEATARVAGGRSATYAGGGAAGSGSSGWVVRLVVRVLPQTAAVSEMDWLRRSMGYCPSDLRLSRARVDGLPGHGAVLGYQVGAVAGHPQSVLVVGVVRQGRATAAVELVVPDGKASDTQARIQLGLDRTRRLLALADHQLESSRLVELAQADPALAS